MRALLLRVLISLLFVAFTVPTTAAAGPKSAEKKVRGKKGKKRVSKRKRRRRRRRRRARRRRGRRKAAAKKVVPKKAAKEAAKKTAKKTDPRIAQAKAAFTAGRVAFSAKNWGEAIIQYKKAYEITKDGLVMGQVALAFEKAGDFKRALESIKVYRSALPQSDRASVNEMVVRYEKLVADGKSKHLTLPGETPPPPAKPPTVVAKKKPLVDPDKPIDKPKKRRRFWTWVALGAAGALAVSALVVGLSAQSKFDEVEDSGCKPNCSNDDVDSIRARAIATDVLWGTALAAGITAGVLFFLEGRGGSGDETKKKDDDLKDLEEESDELVKSFKVTPLVGVGTYGLGADIRF